MQSPAQKPRTHRGSKAPNCLQKRVVTHHCPSGSHTRGNPGRTGSPFNVGKVHASKHAQSSRSLEPVPGTVLRGVECDPAQIGSQRHVPLLLNCDAEGLDARLHPDDRRNIEIRTGRRHTRPTLNHIVTAIVCQSIDSIQESVERVALMEGGVIRVLAYRRGPMMEESFVKLPTKRFPIGCVNA